MPFLHDSISTFGTGEHEYGKDFNSVKYNFECDFTEFKNPLTINYSNEKVKLLSDTVGLVEAEASVEFYSENNNLYKLFLRFTTILVLENGAWLITHSHLSMPSEDQNEGEAFPLDALQARNNRLTALVELRTKELEEKSKLLEQEKTKTESLLYNILPEKIAKNLMEKGINAPQKHDNVTVLFTDFKDFTKMSSTTAPDKLVRELNEIFNHFDNLIKEYSMEKIKTIGDSYMAVCGLPEPDSKHALKATQVAIKMLEFINKRNLKNPIKWDMRVGLNSGPVIAGIVGNHKFAYDLWGDTVNTASRMERHGEIGKVNISELTYNCVKEDPEFSFESRGKVQAKGKGEVEMYFVSLQKT